MQELKQATKSLPMKQIGKLAQQTAKAIPGNALKQTGKLGKGIQQAAKMGKIIKQNAKKVPIKQIKDVAKTVNKVRPSKLN